MTMSAPSSRARAALASSAATTSTRAPASFATWTAMLFTPPPAPTIRTDSPGRSPARWTSMRQAVSATSSGAAASAKPMPSGMGTRLPAGTATRSAAPPRRCSPSTR